MAVVQAWSGKRSKFRENPNKKIEFVSSPRRVRVKLHGETIADTTKIMLMRETGHVPVYYFPQEDLRMELFTPTDHHTHCPYKGDADYWTVGAGGEAEENLAWAYQDPFDEIPAIKGYVGFYWGRMDSWWEEDEEIFGHARDPLHRVDAILSHRPVRVVLGGETVAETSDARFVFETSHQTRYYIPAADVRMDLLSGSGTLSVCPYKGAASYFSATVGGATYDDIAWSYADPIPECPAIRGLVCFFDENVDATFVDGEEVPKVETKWSKKEK